MLNIPRIWAHDLFLGKGQEEALCHITGWLCLLFRGPV